MPLIWLLIVTSVAAIQKLFSDDLRIGFLSHARHLSEQLAAGTLPQDQLAKAPHLIFNDYLDAGLTLLFISVSWILAVETLRVCVAIVRHRPYPPCSETKRIPSRLVEGWVRD